MASDIVHPPKERRWFRAAHFWAPAAILLAIAVRQGIYLWLHDAGYFYGTAWDTFTRTLLAYAWPGEPCFYCFGGYWLPLQFWVVGTIYGLLKPIIQTTEILVPVAVNNVFWAGSLWITYRIGKRIGGQWVGIIACLLAAFFSGDIFVTYTALSEPILIFFILLTSYCLVNFIQAEPERKGVEALKLGVAAMLATATHYIGWFLALFVSFFVLTAMVKSLRKKEKRSLVFFIAVLLCGAIPLVWLVTSYQTYGDALHSVQVARGYQEAGVGALPPGNRFLLPLQVLVGKFAAITIVGCLSMVYIYRRERGALLFMAAPTFILGMIWLTTALALSAPDQEPRYLVFWCWACLPYIAYASTSIWQRPGYAGKLVVSLGLLILLVVNLLDVVNFKNSFGTDVRDTGVQAELFLKQAADHRVLIEGNTESERRVIPVVSGYPGRVYMISNNELGKKWDKTMEALLSPDKDWLVIVQSNRFVKRARTLGLTVRRFGQYFVIYPPGY